MSQAEQKRLGAGFIEQPEFRLQARTWAFFRQDVRRLAAELTGRVIVDPRSGTRVRVDEVQPFGKVEGGDIVQVGSRYGAMNEMKPGDIWAPPQRRILQVLIVASDHAVPEMSQRQGACARILRSSTYNPETHDFDPSDKEGSTAKILRLEKYEIARLAFLDESEMLYLVRENRQ